MVCDGMISINIDLCTGSIVMIITLLDSKRKKKKNDMMIDENVIAN